MLWCLAFTLPEACCSICHYYWSSCHTIKIPVCLKVSRVLSWSPRPVRIRGKERSPPASAFFCSALFGSVCEWWTRWQHVSRGTVSTLFSNVCSSTLNLINQFKQRAHATLNLWWNEISIYISVCDLALHGKKKTLCYEYEWHDVRLHVSMRAGVCVNGTECEPPAVLIQTHTYNTDGVMTFCTSDSCGVFSSLKPIWENENVWPRVATERTAKCKRCFWSFGSIHHKHFINLYIF